MRKVTLGECGLDTLTLALAYVYFEMVKHPLSGFALKMTLIGRCYLSWF